MPVTLVEVMMAAPDVVCLHILDEKVATGAFVQLGSPDAGAYSTWLTRPDPTHGNVNDLAMVVGKDKDHLRFQDKMPTINNYLGRAAVLNAAGYGTIGGRTVTGTSLKSHPWSQGNTAGNIPAGSQTVYAASTFRHFLFLKLDANLPQGGPYTIDIPAGANFADPTFTFDDRVLRSNSIKASFIGHRPSGDLFKLAYLAAWIPGVGNEGQTDFINTYGLKTFEIINAGGITVFRGDIVQRISPTTDEPSGGAGVLARYTSTIIPPITVTNMIAGTPGTVVAPGHGLSANDFVAFRGCQKVSHHLFYKVGTVIDPDQFTILNANGTNLTISGTYTTGTNIAGYTDQMFKTYQANNCGTYVFGCDYSAWVPPGPGNFRLRVPGLGVSDPFPIGLDVYHEAAKVFAAGDYNQRAGMALDGRFGMTRGAPFRDGVGGFTIFKSVVPAIFASTTQYITGGAGAVATNVCGYGTNLTSTRIDAGGEWMDAGDWDIFSDGHASVALSWLNVCRILIEKGSHQTSFNIPQSKDVCDANLYPDGLPDLLNSGIWGTDWYRRCQEVDGSVPSGMDGSAPDNVYSGNGESSIQHEPSYLTRSQWYTFAPDHLSNYAYAEKAALVSTCARLLGHTALADTYMNSAVSAFNWAEGVATAGAAQDAQYKTIPTTQIVFTANITSGQFTLTGASSTADILPGMEVGGIFNFSGTTVNGNAQITGIDSTAGITVGSTITSLNSPSELQSASVVNSIDDTTPGAGKITLNKTATINGTAIRLSSSHVTNLPLSSTNSNSWVDTIDSGTQITFKNVAPKGSTLPAVGNSTGMLLIARYPGMGWSSAMYTVNMTSINSRNNGNRGGAAGALFSAVKLAGGNASAYEAIVQTLRTLTNFQNLDNYGYFAYAATPGADTATANAIANNFQSSMQTRLLTYSENVNAGYRILGVGAGVLWVHTVLQQFTWCIFGDYLQRKLGLSTPTRLRSALEAALACAHGANQKGSSFTTGIGPRYPIARLHEDAQALGIDGPFGVTSYGHSGVNFGLFPVSFTCWANTQVSNMNDTCGTAADLAANFVPQRIVEPYCMANPVLDNWWENGSQIFDSEFTIQQTVLGQLAVAAYLHGWDGNTGVSPRGRNVRGKF